MKHKTHHHITLPIPSNGADYASDSGNSSNSPRSRRRPSRGPRRFRSGKSRNQSSFWGLRTSAWRRHYWVVLVLALLYVVGFVWFMGMYSSVFLGPPAPGSVYRSPLLFLKLWPWIQRDISPAIEIKNIKERITRAYFPLFSSGSDAPNGYLIVEANGGLNQQRTSICNAVAVARLLNAILVIPRFDYHSVWKDPSQFGDIYDEDHFIETLKDYVTVVKELPTDLMERYNNNIGNVPNVKVRAWALASFYLQDVHPILLENGVIRIAPFANRLANNIPPDIQFVRCLANYQALRFSAPISTLAQKIVSRMIQKSSETRGKYVAVHLRFEEVDMVAFSCCIYDGGWMEKFEMDYTRRKGWKDKFTQRGRIINPGLNRMNGRCPLTPLEVGMMLRGMGFSNNTSIYIASGTIYNAKRNMAPFFQMFPLVQTKEYLATQQELSFYKDYSSRLAALDYAVCLLSEVFVTTQGGNFPHFLIGHRRFLYGHGKTIKPDKRKLALILHDTSLSWEAFKEQMNLILAESDREGKMELKFKKASKQPSIFEHPSQECRCVKELANWTT
ncbi:hypothetical protein Scep_019162 [Stephania cephalantha]|uniref:O-fucosyltransferase family protein n=1 Tax=Stephania cephalantha TaxID=152367 RepID=A0AAP0IAC8_9MAGN